MKIFILILVICISTSWVFGKDFFELVKTGTPKQVQAAIAHGAKVNDLNDGMSPLMLAAAYNPNPEVITVLLKAGADGKCKSAEDMMAFDYANNNMKLLASKVYIDLAKASGLEIFALVKAGTPEQVETALANGARVDGRYRFLTLLNLAARNTNPEMIRLLLKAGAKVDELDKNGMTALMWAAWANTNVEVIDTLLKAGAKIDARDNATTNDTPLLYATSGNKNPEVIAALLKAGAKLDERGKTGRTPLMLATHNYYSAPRVAATLLQAGARIDDRDNSGQTALVFALWPGSINIEVVNILLKAGAKADDHDNQNNTPLMLAAYSCKNPKVITLLLKAGAKVDDQNNDGMTPLMLAVGAYLDPEAINTPVKPGTITNTNTNTESKKSEITLKIINILLKAGANPNLKSREGKSALDYTYENEDLIYTAAFRALKKATLK